MSMLRDQLTRQIQRKVQAHGLVIWEDAAHEYATVASSVIPDGISYEAFDGSWYELRRRVEPLVASETPPDLVLYVPPPPPEDPLAELRAAGAVFKRNLATLVQHAFEGKLSPPRIADIAKQARTLPEAEAAAENTGDADVSLIRALGPTDATGMIAKVLGAQFDDALTTAGAWGSFSDLCLEAVGAQISGRANELRSALFSYLVLCELDSAAPGVVPGELTTTWSKPAPEQQHRAVQVLERLRSTETGRAAYRRLASDLDDALGLSDLLSWRPGLDRVPGPTSVDTASFRAAINQLDENEHSVAADIALNRLSFGLASAEAADFWATRWRTVKAICALQEQLRTHAVPNGSTGQLLRWYVEGGWQVDRAHRRLELARTELAAFGALEDGLTAARVAYAAWLDKLINRFTAAMAFSGLEIDGLMRQGEIHDRFVDDQQALTAYVWVDALRYELGADLVDALARTIENVSFDAAVAAAPTITVVGMANLLPSAASALNLSLDGDRLHVRINSTDIDGVPARRSLLQARHGRVADLDLNEASQQGEQALKRAIGDAKLVLLRSQEVDAAGESGLLSVAWPHFETVVILLASVIARLAQAGVQRVVITADHGFIALSQDLGTHQLVDAPQGAKGTTKRRVFIGRGGVPNPATVRIPLSECGIAGEIDLVVPRGLAVFKAGGGRQFFHGGLSPQELVVPVIVFDLKPAPEPQRVQVEVVVAGKRVTTGVFSATLTFQGDLFTEEVTLRVIAAGAKRQPVARVVGGDDYDAATGTITVESGRPSVLTFQVTRNLTQGSTIELQVLDARTGHKISSQDVQVSAAITIEDELD